MTDRIDLSEQPAGPAAASAPAEGSVVFDHLRAEDGEHVGYLEIADDGRFIPYDLLRRRRGAAMDLDEAEALLDGIGLRMLAEDWLLREDGPGEAGESEAPGGAPSREAVPDGPTWTRVRIREIGRDRVVVGRAMESTSEHVARTIDLTGSIEVPLPTDRLLPAHG